MTAFVARPRRALVVGVLHVVAGVLPGFLAASLAPRIDADFPFGESALGLAVAAVYVVCAFASSTAGRLADRLGAARSMRAAVVPTIVCCLGIALVADSAAALLALLVVGGIGNAITAPAASALLDRHVPEARWGVAYGAMQAGAPFGALAAGLALPAVAIPFGWRWAYAATAVLALATVLAAPATSDGRTAPAAASRRPRGPGSVHALAVTAWLASAAGTGLISFIVLYAVESGLSQSAAGLLLGGLSLAAATSRIALGLASDRSGGLVLLIAGEPAAVVAGALIAGAVGWAWPGALTTAVVQRAPGAPAWAVGVLMAGLFAGAVTGPLVTGFLAEREQFTAAWLALAAFALLAAATVLLVARAPRTTRRP